MARERANPVLRGCDGSGHARVRTSRCRRCRVSHNPRGAEVGGGKSSTKGRDGKWGAQVIVQGVGVRTRLLGTASLQLRPKMGSSTSTPRPPQESLPATK